jgi:hypothetical protein
MFREVTPRPGRQCTLAVHVHRSSSEVVTFGQLDCVARARLLPVPMALSLQCGARAGPSRQVTLEEPEKLGSGAVHAPRSNSVPRAD